MPAERDAEIVIVRRSQVQSLNDKIARLTAVNPWADIHRFFSVTAQLGSDAVAGGEELLRMPGTAPQVFDQALEFWQQVRNYNSAAAAAVAGGNLTLAEALVTFRLLQSLSGSESVKRAGEASH